MAASSSSQKTVSLGPQFEMSYHEWSPAEKPRAAILLLHGFGEHAGRYERLGNFLAARGFYVIAPDARGHGRSSGKRGHVLRFDQYLDDLDDLMRKTRTGALGEVPWFVVGHSMGGLVALRFVLRNQAPYRGLVVSNPLLGLAFKVPVVKDVVGRLLSSIWPTLTMGNEINPDNLSRDRSVGEAYMKDPLVHHQVSTRWFTEMLAAVSRTHEESHALKIPTLFLLSTDDRLVNMKAAHGLFEKLGNTAKQLKIYEGLYHEIFNELEADQVFSDLVSWLEAQLSGTPNKA